VISDLCSSDPFPIGATDIWTAAGVPTSSAYPDGTLYLRTDYGDVYRYRSVSAATPALVQQAVALGGGSGGLSATLGATPTLGDVLVAFGFSGYTQGLPTLNPGWILISETASGGSQWPSRISAYRYVQAGDGAVQTPFGGDIETLALFEVSGLSTSWGASFQTEQTILTSHGSPASTVSASTTNTNTLAIAAFSTDQSTQYLTGAGTISGLTGTLSGLVGNGSTGAWDTSVAANSELFSSSASSVSVTYNYAGYAGGGGSAGDMILLQSGAAEDSGWQPLSALRTIQAQGTTIELDPLQVNFAAGLIATSDTAGHVTVSATVGATTVSALPLSPTTGLSAVVTDATSCTFNSTPSGGGSTRCPVVWNGVAWVAG
jgi:hypothetical protein